MAETASSWVWEGDNPISGFGMNIEFAQPFSPAAITNASKFYSKLKRTFPRQQTQQTVMIPVSGVVGAGMHISPAQVQASPGFTFDRVAQNGTTEEAISAIGQNVLFQTVKYKKWGQTLTTIKAALSYLLPPLMQNNSLVSISLQYTDLFLWSGKESTADYTALLQNTPYIAGSALNSSDLWHSHHGFFVVEDGPKKRRLLENVNINVTDKNDVDELPEDQDAVRAVDVTLFHRILLQPTLASEGAEQREQAQTIDNPELIEECLTLMHARNKEALAKLLNPAVTKRIPKF